MAFNDQRNLNSLLLRELYFKDKGNRPISTNRALLARGDGGTYWADTTISTAPLAFNFLRASTIQTSASNVQNTLWFEPGAGIEFYSTSIGGQPIVWIAGKGPQTLQVIGAGSVDLLNLPDNAVGGNTLTFQGSGDMNIYVSDATVTFNATNTSSFSSINGLIDTQEQLLSTTQGLEEEVQGLADTVVTLLISSAVSTFWSTLLYTKNLAENLSTFVYSTFHIENNVLNITYPDVYISSLTVDVLNAPTVITSTYSSLYWSSGFGLNTVTNNLYVSTIIGNNAPLVNFDNENYRLGINLGLVPPRTTVDVSGIVFAHGFVTPSDRRLKSAFEPLRARSVPQPYRFSWIRDGTGDIGCMADEVEALAPECVFTGDDGYKAVNYAKLVPYCFSVIQDLQARVEALEFTHQ